MRLRRNFVLSFRALFTHRLRAILALLSVSIGVVAIVLTSAIGTGAQRDVQRKIESMGVNLLVVRPALVKRFVARRALSGPATTLRTGDYEAIVGLPLIAAAAPGAEGTLRAKAGSFSSVTRILGTTEDFPVVRRFTLESGHFFTADDDRSARRVAVLGARVATALFEGDPVGEEVRIRGVPFDVIGVLAAKGALADGDEDNQVLVPLRTAQRRVFNNTWLNVVFVSVADPNALTAAERAIDSLMLERHRRGRDGARDFEIQNAARFFGLQRQAASSLDRLTVALSVLALIVGGTGIMGLMLLSVRERTSEIGLRMAVGAKPRDVLLQFLSEATLLSLGGWTLGLGFGAAAAATVKLALAWQVAVPAATVFASLGMALVIGLGFGAVPAYRAANLPPVRALLTK